MPRPTLTMVFYDPTGKVASIEHRVVHEAQADFQRGKGMEAAYKGEDRNLLPGEMSAATIAAVTVLIASIQADVDIQTALAAL